MLARSDSPAKIVIGGIEYLRPHATIHAGVQRWEAIGGAVQHVKFMGEFMDHHVHAIHIARMRHVCPRKNDWTPQPCLPGVSSLVGFHKPVRIAKLVARNKFRRINDDLNPALVMLDAEFEYQDTGLNRNAEFHFQAEFEPTCSRNLLLVQEQS